MKKYSEHPTSADLNLSTIYNLKINYAKMSYLYTLRDEFKSMGIEVLISDIKHVGVNVNDEYLENGGWVELDEYLNDNGSKFENLTPKDIGDMRHVFLKCNYAGYVFYIGFLDVVGTKFKIFTYRPGNSPFRSNKLGMQAFFLKKAYNNSKFWEKDEFNNLDVFKKNFEKAINTGWIEFEKEILKKSRGAILTKKTGIV